MARYVKLSTYRKRAYHDGEAPDPRTLRKRIDSGELPGKREGSGHYYVLVDDKTGLEAHVLQHIKPINDLAAQVLSKAQNS